MHRPEQHCLEPETQPRRKPKSSTSKPKAREPWTSGTDALSLKLQAQRFGRSWLSGRALQVLRSCFELRLVLTCRAIGFNQGLGVRAWRHCLRVPLFISFVAGALRTDKPIISKCTCSMRFISIMNGSNRLRNEPPYESAESY